MAFLSSQSTMLIDLQNSTKRQEFLDDQQVRLVDYVLDKIKDDLDPDDPPSVTARELNKIMSYLDEHLVLEFKD